MHPPPSPIPATPSHGRSLHYNELLNQPQQEAVLLLQRSFHAKINRIMLAHQSSSWLAGKNFLAGWLLVPLCQRTRILASKLGNCQCCSHFKLPVFFACSQHHRAGYLRIRSFNRRACYHLAGTLLLLAYIYLLSLTCCLVAAGGLVHW